MDIEFGLVDINRMIKKYFVLIFGITFMTVIISVLIMYYLITPKYSSQTELLVNQHSEQQVIQYSEIQTNIQLINTYRAIITGHSVLSQVNENLDDEYGIETLSNVIAVNQPANSQTFYITASMDSPEEAQKIVKEVLETFENILEVAYEHMNVSIFVLSPPSFNLIPDTPRPSFYIIGGAIIGLVISIAFVLYTELLDTTIKDHDFFNQFGIMNLGSITEIESKNLKDTEESVTKKIKTTTSEVNNNEDEITPQILLKRTENQAKQPTLPISIKSNKHKAFRKEKNNQRRRTTHKGGK